MTALITGGARSGKSIFAEAYAAKLGSRGFYIATAQLYDKEMEERAAQHRARRRESQFHWDTQEEPYEVAALLRQLEAGTFPSDGPDRRTCDSAVQVPQQAGRPVVLVDCLTLWLSNWLLRLEGGGDGSRLSDKIDELVAAAAAYKGPLLLVTNEVGDGIVPEYPLGREFRDWSGIMNRRLAEVSGQVFLVTAGIPVELKALAFRLD